MSRRVPILALLPLLAPLCVNAAPGALDAARAAFLASQGVFAGASGPSFTPLARMSTPWLQDAFVEGMRGKFERGTQGFCSQAQALYRFDGVEQRPGAETLYMLTMEGVKHAMNDVIARHYPTGRTGLRMIISGSTDVSDPEAVRKFIGRSIDNDKVIEAVLAHAEEFARPAKRVLIHTDSAWLHKDKEDARAASSVLRFIAFIDLEKREIALIGDGECEF